MKTTRTFTEEQSKALFRAIAHRRGFLRKHVAELGHEYTDDELDKLLDAEKALINNQGE